MKIVKKKKAFTLIELVIVISIIAILAAIAIPKYKKSKDQAAITAHNANVSMLKTAAMIKLNETSVNEEEIIWTRGNEEVKEYVENWPEIPKGNGRIFKDYTEYKVIISPKEREVKVEPDRIETKNKDSGK